MTTPNPNPNQYLRTYMNFFFQSQKNMLKNWKLKLKPGWRVFKIYKDIHIRHNFFQNQNKNQKKYTPSAIRILFRF
jgi:hypothetical protein